MLFEIFAWEVGVAFHYIDDDGAPGFDVARLSLVKEDEGANDFGAESEKKKISTAFINGRG